MNDRYLFKAKRKNWRELPKEEQWVQGRLFDNGFSGNIRYFVGGLIIQECKSGVCEGWYVAATDFYEVDQSTICQCTGLKDKAGNLIFENDIVTNEDFAGVVMFGEYDGNVHKNIGFFIEWGEGYYRQDLGYWANKIKVIGMVVE